jgi:hypothetical protein
MALALGILGALAWAVPAQAQTTVRFQQDKNGYKGVVDTYIDQFWDDFFGGTERIEIRHWDNGAGVTEKMKALIKFDVTTLPLDATVTSAKLTLFSIRARGQNGDVPIVEKVTSTWDNKTKWSTAPSAVATSVTCPPVTAPPPVYTDDPVVPEMYVITGLESLVQGWIASPTANFGIQLSCTTNLNFKWASSEYPDSATYSPYRPELEVTFTTPAPLPPPTITVTSPPSSASSPLNISGTASATSPATVTQVTWQNLSSGASGVASGTTSWTATIPLITGDNLIQVTVTDSLGKTASTSFTVKNTSQKAAPKESKICGLGVSGGTPWVGVAALGIALLMVAATRRSL